MGAPLRVGLFGVPLTLHSAAPCGRSGTAKPPLQSLAHKIDYHISEKFAISLNHSELESISLANFLVRTWQLSFLPLSEFQ